MAGGKQYKNVYTILEKVKKGEIKTHYKNEGGLFGKLQFYKKPDLVKPYLHYIDENRLDLVMDQHMADRKTIAEHFDKFAKTSEYRKVEEGKRPDATAFQKKFNENYRKFPKHIAKDIFKMYYNKIENLDFEERTDKNHTKFKFLERANNPVGKIMSERSNLKSAIFARNIMSYLIARMTMLDFIDEDMSNQIKKGLNGESDFDNAGIDQALKNAFDNNTAKKMLDEAVQKAQDLCKEMDNVMDQETQQQMFEAIDEPGSNQAGNLSSDYIKTVTQKLESVKLSMGSLKERIKKLMDRSVSYFSSKTETTYEDLFNTDNISGLEDYVLLHPQLRKLFVEDLQVKDTKNIGKIDIYIDISGSMHSGCGVRNEEGTKITKLEFCKAFAAKLKSLDLLNDVYLFNNKVKAWKNDIISIAMINGDGGTCIDTAVSKIERNGNNALVITDAEDRCSIYSEKAFFIGVQGARFSHFNESVIKEYSNKGQVVVFDGEKIQKVDQEGYAVE